MCRLISEGYASTLFSRTEGKESHPGPSAGPPLTVLRSAPGSGFLFLFRRPWLILLRQILFKCYRGRPRKRNNAGIIGPSIACVKLEYLHAFTRTQFLKLARNYLTSGWADAVGDWGGPAWGVTRCSQFPQELRSSHAVWLSGKIGAFASYRNRPSTPWHQPAHSLNVDHLPRMVVSLVQV